MNTQIICKMFIKNIEETENINSFWLYDCRYD